MLCCSCELDINLLVEGGGVKGGGGVGGGAQQINQGNKKGIWEMENGKRKIGFRK